MKRLILASALLALAVGAEAEERIPVPDSGWVSFAGSWHNCAEEDVWFEVVDSPPRLLLHTPSGTYAHWTPTEPEPTPRTEEELLPSRLRHEAREEFAQVVRKVWAKWPCCSPEESLAVTMAVDSLIAHRMAQGDSTLRGAEYLHPRGGEFRLDWGEYRSYFNIPRRPREKTLMELLPPDERNLLVLHNHATRLVQYLNRGAVLFLDEDTTARRQPAHRVYMRHVPLVVAEVERIRAGHEPVHGILDSTIVATLRGRR